MKLDKLIEANRTFEPTVTDIVAMVERLALAEVGFAEDAKAKLVTQEWLSREYTI